MRRYWILIVFSILMGACPAWAQRPTAGLRVIEMVADKDARFKLTGQKKQELVLKAGERVVLRVTARPGPERARDGAVHSLVVRSLRDQGWDVRLHEGTQDLVMTAPAKPGDYLIECTVKCGPGHDDMHLKMHVVPN